MTPPNTTADTNSKSGSKLSQLREMTTVVADTGDIDAIQRYQPVDATTNPSLILKAAQLPRYASLVQESIAQAKREQSDWMAPCMDELAVAIGGEILNIIPGRISTEIDARLSFDADATVARGMKLMERYQRKGIGKERILLKIAATWEGIQAAEMLENRGIQCNLTLLFSFRQAAAAADAGVFLISPFVGRILDWYKANSEQQEYPPHEDPGVLSVKNIYNFYKQRSYNTVVMGASFRSTGQIEALAGCDRLTISPQLLEALDSEQGPLTKVLDPSDTGRKINYQKMNESAFRYQMNANAMATDKLSEGIRNFVADQEKLEKLLSELADA